MGGTRYIYKARFFSVHKARQAQGGRQGKARKAEESSSKVIAGQQAGNPPGRQVAQGKK